MSRDYQKIAQPGVQCLQPYVPGKPVEELQRELGLSNIVKLASNENPLGPAPAAIAAAQAVLADCSRYPDGSGFRIKQVLAERHGVDEACITLGNGSNDVLELVARAFAGPCVDVIYSEHAFAVYAIVTQAVGAQAVVTPAREFGHDLDAMSAAITDHTRLVFIADPNNPTGTQLDADALQLFVAATPADVLVIIDQAYFDYAQGPGYADCIDWVARYPNLIVTRTFSKAYGLAGLRIGYSVSSPDVADLLNRVRQPFNVNSAALAAAEAALGADGHLQQSLALNRQGMTQLTAAFSRLGLQWIPSAGNFVSVDVQRRGSDVFESLLKQGVIVRPVDNYGMPNHLRVTVGLEAENATFITALQRVLDD